MRTGRNFLYSLLGSGLPLLLAVVAVPVVGRVAGYERLGFLTIVWAAIGYLGFLDFGLSRVFARRVAVAAAAGDLAGETAFLRWTTRRLFAVCVIAAIVVAIAVPPTWLAGSEPSAAWLAEVRGAWILLAASIPPLVLSNVWRGAIEGRGAFGVSNVFRVAMGAWTFGAPLLVVAFTHTLPALVGGIVLGRWFSLLLHQGWCRRHLPWDAAPLTADPATRRAALGHTLAEGGWVTVSSIVGPVMVVFDRFVLGAVAALASVTVYAIPQEVVLRMLLVPGLLAGVLFPRLAVLAQTDTAAGASLINRATRITIVMQLPFCLVLAWIAQPLLQAWLGADLATPAAPILRWLLVGCIVNTAAQVPFAHLQASGRSRITARIHLAELLPYCALLYWAVSRDGALGAAWAWSLRCGVDAALMLMANGRIDPRILSPRLVITLLGALAATVVAALAFGPFAASGVPGWTAALAIAAASAAVALAGLERKDALDLLRRLSPGVVTSAKTGIRTFLVVVEFGAVLRESEHRRLRQLAQNAGASILHVRNDRSPGLTLLDPNRAFEFSGFQDGLQAALASTHGANDADWLRIVFANDTVFRSHLPGYARALLATLLALFVPGKPSGVCVGVAGPVPGSLTVDGSVTATYLSTWAFAVCAPRGALQRLRFFDDHATQEHFAAIVWPGLPASYRESIDAWLDPVHYLKGWHQAIPGRRLDEATRQRKRLSIYLENTLALRAERAGIAMLDIEDTAASALARGVWTCLKLADRIYCNLRKLRHRARVTLTPT